ncbi:hypothetical protein D9M69_343730 [compost metagenome]
MHGVAFVAGEFQALGGQFVALCVQLIDVHRIGARHTRCHVRDHQAAGIDAGRGDARAIGDGQAGGVDQGVAQGDAVDIQIAVEGDGHLAILVRTALGYADVAVARERDLAVRADVGAVAGGVADVPAGRGQIGHALELRHVHCVAIGGTCGHTGDLASLASSRIAHADGTQGALPYSTGVGGSQLRQGVVPRDTCSSIGDRACA